MKKPGRSDQANSLKTKKSHEINHEKSSEAVARSPKDS